MSRIDPDQPLLASVLDRLLDEDPQTAIDPPKSRGQHLAALRRSLQRDLENLLNTHQCCRAPPDGLDELGTSLLDYGMPHFLGLSVAGSAAREAFRVEIEAMLRRFEPRFKRVTVTLRDNVDEMERTLRFRIDALVHADPQPESVSFESSLEPIHRRFAVRTAARE